ncbi:uncharacterized protein LOC119670746 isoform X1 [Teleopsis dalmanni]|uniref:uncharacterized protein LOC119670746 isoform X1 n=1 Tax=Teleopsis dalmanni TaxID=139649 RepID=UPI0018CD8786|nr:uncharacterized protein LOC119670746 isoform X1 [Teleopsis dalmanni]
MDATSEAQIDNQTHILDTSVPALPGDDSTTSVDLGAVLSAEPSSILCGDISNRPPTQISEPSGTLCGDALKDPDAAHHMNDISIALENMNDNHDRARMSNNVSGNDIVHQDSFVQPFWINVPITNSSSTVPTVTIRPPSTSLSRFLTSAVEATTPRLVTSVSIPCYRDLYPRVIPGGFLNLTALYVPEEAEILLSFGPKYCPITPPTIQDYYTILCTDHDAYIEACEDLSAYCKLQMEEHFTKFLEVMVKHQNPTRFHHMLRYLFHITLDFLHRHKDVLAVQSDNGSTTILISKQNYISKVNAWLDSYIARGECVKYCDDVGQLVRKLGVHYHEIFNSLCRIYKDGNPYPQGIHKELEERINEKPTLPYLYGTIKTHKLDHPIHPICSSINWYTNPLHKLCQFILQTTLKGRLSSHNILDIDHLTDHFLQIKPRRGYVLVTMKIKDIYTDTRITSLWRVLQYCMEQSWFQSACPIDVKLLHQLLDYILNLGNYFTFDGNLYHQMETLSQDGDAAEILATLYLDSRIELHHSTLFLSHSIFAWWKCVDNVLLYMNQSCVSSFMRLFPQMTEYDVSYEVERLDANVGCHPFVTYLDYRIMRTSSSFLLSVHHKPSESLRTVHFTSHVSTAIKRNAIISHLRKVLFRTSDAFVHTDLLHYKTLYLVNGYPHDFIKTEMRNMIMGWIARSQNTGQPLTRDREALLHHFLQSYHQPKV